MFKNIQYYQRVILIGFAWLFLGAMPQQAFAAYTYKQIGVGNSHACGLKNDGSAVCWGNGSSNSYGQSIAPGGIFTQISVGSMHTCGLRSDGSATCWGAGKTNTGVLPESGQSTIPNGTFTQLSAGDQHTCGLKSDGSAACWGSDIV